MVSVDGLIDLFPCGIISLGFLATTFGSSTANGGYCSGVNDEAFSGLWPWFDIKAWQESLIFTGPTPIGANQGLATSTYHILKNDL